MMATIPTSSDSPSTDWRTVAALRRATGFCDNVVISGVKDGRCVSGLAPLWARSSSTLRQRLRGGRLRGRQTADTAALLGAPAPSGRGRAARRSPAARAVSRITGGERRDSWARTRRVARSRPGAASSRRAPSRASAATSTSRERIGRPTPIRSRGSGASPTLSRRAGGSPAVAASRVRAESGISVPRLLVGLKEHGPAGQQVAAQAGLEIQDGLARDTTIENICVTDSPRVRQWYG